MNKASVSEVSGLLIVSSIPCWGNMNSDSVETEQETIERYKEEDKLFVDVESEQHIV